MTHFRRNFSAGAVLAVLIAIAPGVLLAQDGNGVEITNAALREVEVKAPDGTVTRQLVKVERAVPGDEVVYEISYRNAGSATATDVAIANPLPPAVTFLSASVPPTEVSVDGGKVFGPLAQLKVKQADGQTRNARAADITNLRWIVPTLSAGAEGKFVYRVKVK